MANFPGTRRRVTFTCENEAGTAADPTALEVEYRRLYDDPTTKAWPADVEVVRASTGVFYIDVDCPDAGTWVARAEATGTLIGATEISWIVETSSFD